QGHLVTTPRQGQRLPEADDACAADGDVARWGHWPGLRHEGNAFAAWVCAAFEPVRRDGDDGKSAREVEALDLMAEPAHAFGERIPRRARLKPEGPAGRDEMCG